MHPFLLSVFISCIYFELIFKMKSVDNTSANPRISIAGNAVPKKIAATIVAATGSTLDNNPAYTLPAYFTAARYRQNGKIVPTITIVRKPTITIISRCASILHGLKNTASSIPMIRPFGEMYNAWIFPCVATRKIPAFIFRLFLCGLFPCTHFIHARYLCYTRRSYDLMRRILLLRCSRSSSLPMSYGLRNLQILFLLSECNLLHPEVS